MAFQRGPVVFCRRAFFVACTVALAVHVRAGDGAGQDGVGLMQPGIKLDSLRVIMSPFESSSEGLIEARRAEIDGSGDSFTMEGFRYHAAGADPFHFRASVATYDPRSKRVRVAGRFEGEGGGMQFGGIGLTGKMDEGVFLVDDLFEARLKVVFPRSTGEWTERPAVECPFGGFSVPSFDWRHPRWTGPVELLQDFSGGVAAFARFWGMTEDELARPGPADRRSVVLAGRSGGRLDWSRFDLDFRPPAAVIARELVVVSHGGMKIFEEEIDGLSLIRALGQGGIHGWMAARDDAGPTLIIADSFEYVSDTRVLQFAGGPLRVKRPNGALCAQEEWQFLRVFEGGRMVLSTGDWQLMGAAGGEAGP